jgi:hypothetical protein
MRLTNTACVISTAGAQAVPAKKAEKTSLDGKTQERLPGLD